jgi:protein-L-isoaspartate(D-aspartate) O-methyltransferase
MIDDFKHKGLRAKMIEELKKKGILNEIVLQAIHKIPRHFFIQDNTFLKYAYSTDEAFPIGAGQTISRPHTVAFQTELLQVKKGDKIL